MISFAYRNKCTLILFIFTVRCYASTVYAIVMCLHVCLCVCVYVTLWYCIKTDKHRMMQIMPHDSPGTLDFWCQRSPWN